MDSSTSTPSLAPRRGVSLPDDLRTALRALVDRQGERAVAEQSGLSATTLVRALSGLGVNRGTVALIRAVVTTSHAHTTDSNGSAS